MLQGQGGGGWYLRVVSGVRQRRFWESGKSSVWLMLHHFFSLLCLPLPHPPPFSLLSDLQPGLPYGSNPCPRFSVSPCINFNWADMLFFSLRPWKDFRYTEPWCQQARFLLLPPSFIKLISNKDNSDLSDDKQVWGEKNFIIIKAKRVTEDQNYVK